MAPNDAQMRSAGVAGLLGHAGRFDEAIEWASQALAQPHNSAFAKYYKANLAWVLYLAGRYQEALENVKGSETIFPDVMAAIYVRVGHAEEARAIIADLLKRSPFSIATESCLAIKEPMKASYLADLRQGGIAEEVEPVRRTVKCSVPASPVTA